MFISFKNNLLKRSIAIVSILALVLSIFNVSQTVSAQQVANPSLTPDQQAALQAQLNDIEQQIAQQQTILDTTQKEGKSIQGDITILDAQIKQAQLKIQAHTIAIANLGKDITVKTQVITGLNGQINQGQQSLSQILEKTNELDSYSLAEVILSRKNISDFFQDLDTFNSIQEEMQTYFTQVKTAKAETQQEQQALDAQQNEEIDSKINVEQEQAKIKTAEAQKEQLLSLNKNQQKQYQTILANKQQQAATIKAELFVLLDTPNINFGQAYKYAQVAGSKANVDPAFLLAIITQESNLGQNVGSCYLKDTTGVGVKASTGATVQNLMKPDRDVQPFLTITAAVGRDPYHTLVSCPFSTGYGGAMGPAQFIPSTWALNESRVGAALGKAVPDPWNPQDAFMASALYLSDIGAVSGSYTAERNAACKYYSGRACSGSGNTFYGDQVMAKVTDIQSKIDVLSSTE